MKNENTPSSPNTNAAVSFVEAIPSAAHLPIHGGPDFRHGHDGPGGCHHPRLGDVGAAQGRTDQTVNMIRFLGQAGTEAERAGPSDREHLQKLCDVVGHREHRRALPGLSTKQGSKLQ